MENSIMDEKIDIATTNIITAYIAQIDSAMKISEIISDHDSNTDEIRPDDVICGLIYRLMVPMDTNEMNESLENAKNIMSEPYEDTDEETDESTGEGTDEGTDEDTSNTNDDYPHIINDGVKRQVIVNTCICDICSKVRECISTYHSHEPNDPLATRFRDSITEACTKHNLYI